MLLTDSINTHSILFFLATNQSIKKKQSSISIIINIYFPCKAERSFNIDSAFSIAITSSERKKVSLIFEIKLFNFRPFSSYNTKYFKYKCT